MADVESAIQDSVVTGDVHVGDVHHNIQNTHVDKSTNVELPSLDGIGEKVSKLTNNVFDFVKGIINRALLFATVTVAPSSAAAPAVATNQIPTADAVNPVGWVKEQETRVVLTYLSGTSWVNPAVTVMMMLLVWELMKLPMQEQRRFFR